MKEPRPRRGAPVAAAPHAAHLESAAMIGVCLLRLPVRTVPEILRAVDQAGELSTRRPQGA
jgi:hypothetical protein